MTKKAAADTAIRCLSKWAAGISSSSSAKQNTLRCTRDFFHICILFLFWTFINFCIVLIYFCQTFPFYPTANLWSEFPFPLTTQCDSSSHNLQKLKVARFTVVQMNRFVSRASRHMSMWFSMVFFSSSLKREKMSHFTQLAFHRSETSDIVSPNY